MVSDLQTEQNTEDVKLKIQFVKPIVNIVVIIEGPTL